MIIKEVMTLEELRAYRGYSGVSLQEIRQEQVRLKMNRLVREAKTFDDLPVILTEILKTLY